ncbi:plasmid recombination protein [Sporosarcina sp. SAFN-010]|uniref:plasmid recombination protein n=1 Tax=Sporosarcina sp. SAFN-010 TaxID=3387273 RepID=UPI003F7DC824
MSMSVSLKKATNKTNIKHNNRTMSEKDKERNSHINESYSHENVYLVQKDLKELYQEEFGEALENYNAKQKRNDRKIDNYYEHIQASKKTSLQQEMIIQVGDLDDFPMRKDYEKGNEILLEWFQEFEKRNPNLKVYNAVIHNDEASPHMHLNFVPVASGYKRGLEKQVSFDRAIIQQDSTLDKTRPFDDWREKEVQLLEEKLLDRGIERKLVGTNQYKDVNEYKEKQDLLNEIAVLEGKVSEKKSEFLAISKNVPDKNLVLKPKRKEIKTEVIPKMFGKPEIHKKETGNYVFTPKQMEQLENIVTAAVAVKKDYQRLQSMDPVIENEKLLEEIYQKTRENGKLKNENKELRSENRDLKDLIGDLRHEVGLLYQSAKDFIRGRTETVRAFKNDFKDLVAKVKERNPGSEFERLYKREKRQERDKGLGR